MNEKSPLSGTCEVLVVTDGSYDDRHLFAGHGGVICVPAIRNQPSNIPVYLQDKYSEQYTFHGVSAECADSQQAELGSILLGAAALRRYAIDHPELTNIHVVFYVDLAAVLENHEKLKAQSPVKPLIASAFEKLDVLMRSNGWSYEFKKVSAHVKPQMASLMESLHNKADSLANQSLRNGLLHLFTPNIKDSNYYTVLLDDVKSQRRTSELMRLGYDLASRGMIARIYAGSDQEHLDIVHGHHPFIAGILAYCESMGKEIDQYIDYAYFNSKEKPHPLNLTLYRHYLFDKKIAVERNLDVGDTVQSRQAAFASSLLFGPTNNYSLSQNKTGRLSPASAFVLDLNSTSPQSNSIRSWVYTLLSYTKIPLKRGYLMREFQIPYRGIVVSRSISSESLAKPQQERKVNEHEPTEVSSATPTIASSIQQYLRLTKDGVMSNEQLCRGVIDELAKDGIVIASALAEDALGRYLRAQLNCLKKYANEPDKITEDLYKHIKKTNLSSTVVPLPPQPSSQKPSAPHAAQTEPTTRISVRR